MHRYHASSPKNTTLLVRGLFTLLIWALAALMLTACYKPTSPIQEAEPQKEIVVVPEPVEVVVKKPVVKKPARFSSVTEKKRYFFAFMKPFVVERNRQIAKDRSRLLALMRTSQIADKDLQWLQKMADNYRVEMKAQLDDKFWQQMIARVDIVPVEMALVQAANESAWGQSRFAREGNNFFGQWCYSKGCGIVPNQRSQGSTHEVRRFDSPAESVKAYIRNINRSRAYREFRSIRSAQRSQNQPLDAEKLAMGLKSYSERGMAYVKTIQAMIRSNRKLIATS